MGRWVGSIVGAVIVAAGALGARAEEGPPRATWSITVENDLVGDTDRDYTSGFRLDYVSPKNRLPALGRAARRALFWLDDASHWYVAAGLGQNIYTPTDISLRAPGPDERPYAGFLYGTVAIAADTGERLDTLGLDIGMVGPSARGETVQTEWHRLIGVQLPEGWDRQLKDEVAFRLIYERKWRFQDDYALPFARLEGDLIPHANLSLGTIDTSAGLGLTLRLGQDLSDDYGPPRVRPAVSAPGFFENRDGFSWYLFGAAEARAVGRNLFLEGNTFRDSARVTIHPYVFDLQAGAAVQLKGVELSYTHVFRSPEYIGQSEWAAFGSVNLRLKY